MMGPGAHDGGDSASAAKPYQRVAIAMRAHLIAVVLIALAPLDAEPAAAQTATCRPWCVHFGGRDGGGGTNCGFISFEQCRQTAQGSDVCMPNGACPPPPAPRRR
jgi:hypothetical protein